MNETVRTARSRAATTPARLLAAVVAVLAALALAACGDEAGSSASGAGKPVAVTDDTGKRIELNRPASRVVAIEW